MNTKCEAERMGVIMNETNKKIEMEKFENIKFNIISTTIPYEKYGYEYEEGDFLTRVAKRDRVSFRISDYYNKNDIIIMTDGNFESDYQCCNCNMYVYKASFVVIYNKNKKELDCFGDAETAKIIIKQWYHYNRGNFPWLYMTEGFFYGGHSVEQRLKNNEYYLSDKMMRVI